MTRPQYGLRPARPALVACLIALSAACAVLATACGGNARHAASSHSAGAHTAHTTTTATTPFFTSFLLSATHTSCRSVVYIGDSTSDGEASPLFVPNATLRAPTQFSRVGVKTTYMEVSGARSIHEIYHGIPNAATVARQQVEADFHGCWVLALGTDDAADVAAGSNFGLRTRIAQMLSIIGDQPVLWINEITLPSASAFYRESGMQQWNGDLLAACNGHPLMRVFDWASQAKPSWFIPDGIHYTPDGYIARTHLVAQALVTAFPRDRPPAPGCLVK